MQVSGILFIIQLQYQIVIIKKPLHAGIKKGRQYILPSFFVKLLKNYFGLFAGVLAGVLDVPFKFFSQASRFCLAPEKFGKNVNAC